MSRLACWLFGHKWEPTERSRTSAGRAMWTEQCSRCGYFTVAISRKAIGDD